MDNKTYTFYFGSATPDPSYEDLSTYFQDEYGNCFYHKIVVDEEVFYLYDTCNRMMPLDREFVQCFNTAMYGVSGVYSAADECASLFEQRIREINAALDFWNQKDN